MSAPFDRLFRSSDEIDAENAMAAAAQKRHQRQQQHRDFADPAQRAPAFAQGGPIIEGEFVVTGRRPLPK